MYFLLKFDVWLRWIDSRLQYQDLDKDHYLNILSEKEISQIWTPTLVFENSNEGQLLKFDPSTSEIMVKANGRSKEAPISQLAEGKVSNASETDLRWLSFHIKKFKCEFDLYYLPFDLQTCKVKVRNNTHYLSNEFVTSL